MFVAGNEDKPESVAQRLSAASMAPPGSLIKISSKLPYREFFAIRRRERGAGFRRRTGQFCWWIQFDPHRSRPIHGVTILPVVMSGGGLHFRVRLSAGNLGGRVGIMGGAARE